MERQIAAGAVETQQLTIARLAQAEVAQAEQSLVAGRAGILGLSHSSGRQLSGWPVAASRADRRRTRASRSALARAAGSAGPTASCRACALGWPHPWRRSPRGSGSAEAWAHARPSGCSTPRGEPDGSKVPTTAVMEAPFPSRSPLPAQPGEKRLVARADVAVAEAELSARGSLPDARDRRGA